MLFGEVVGGELLLNNNELLVQGLITRAFICFSPLMKAFLFYIYVNMIFGLLILLYVGTGLIKFPQLLIQLMVTFYFLFISYLLLLLFFLMIVCMT